MEKCESSITKLREVTRNVISGPKVVTHQIEGISPKAVVFPENPAELQKTLEIAYIHKMSVAPWGGGTQISIGNVPNHIDIVLDLSRLNRIIEHNPGDLTATVEAGITLTNLQKKLGEHKQFLAIDTPLPNQATVGGILATGMSSSLKWRYGNPRDTVIGMKVTHPDGKITKSGGQVVKNVSGYDMSRLHVGGLGTLGIITEVSLKLTPLPASETTLIATFRDAEPCINSSLGIFHSDIIPLSITTFNNLANIQTQATSLSGNWFLAIRLGGRSKYLERQLQECNLICKNYHPTKIKIFEATDSINTWRKLNDFGWDEKTTPMVGIRISVTPSDVLEMIQSLQNTTSPERPEPAILSHPAHGTILSGWNMSTENPHADDVTAILLNTIETTQRIGGKSLVEHCPPEIKTKFDVWGDIGNSIITMKRIKKHYDPERILNPGRFVGGI